MATPRHKTRESTTMTDQDLLKAFAIAQDRQPREALALIERALVGAPATRRPLLAHARNILTWFCATYDGHFFQGLDEAIESISQLQDRGFKPALIWAMGTAGFCMGMAGHVELGLKWTDECIHEAKRQHDQVMMQRGSSNRAALLGLLGSFEEAIQAFAELTAAMSSEPGPDRSSVLNNLAFCHLSLAREMPEDSQQGLAHAKTMLSRYDEAEELFREALPNAYVNSRNGAVLMTHYAMLLVKLRRLTEAAKWADEALKIAPEEPFDSTLDLVLESQLMLAQATGDTEGIANFSQRRLTRLQESRRVRVRNAVQHLEITAEAERIHVEARERVEAEVRASRRRLEETQQSLIRAELEVQRARLHERERLLQDMHDGFGSLLASARIQANAGTLTRQDMVEVLDDCMADLHLVADVLSEQDGSLESAMADFRFRCERRLANEEVELSWDLRLAGASPHHHRRNLQILRIVQEALTNALRHAKARRIYIQANVDEDGVLQVEVIDDGQGMPVSHKVGRGLGNMRSRARDIGASVTWRATSPGTSVLLSCPNCQEP